jgi:hypothetical protein
MQARPGHLDQKLPARMPGPLPQHSAGRNGPAAQEPRPTPEFGARTFALGLARHRHRVGARTFLSAATFDAQGGLGTG